MAGLARQPPAGRAPPARRAHRDRRRHRPRGRQRRRDARRPGLPGRGFLLPGLGPARALDRGPGRHQRHEGLRERGRLSPPAVRRHDEGRGLPRPGGERLAARRDLHQHHRPGGSPGRAVQPRVRRDARHPIVRRRARRAHLLLPRADRAAAAARRLLGAPAPGRGGAGACSQPARAARRGSRGRRGARDHRPQPRDRRDRAPRRRRRGARHRRLLQRLLPLDQRDGLQRHRRLARAPARRGVREPLLHPDPSDLDPAVRPLPVEADPDVRVAAKRRPGLGPAQRGRVAGARRDPRAGPLLLPRGAVPAVRQPRAPRRRLAGGEDRVRSRASASGRRGAPSTSTSATRSRSAAPT